MTETLGEVPLAYDEVNIVQAGGWYGYPNCYGDNQPDPEFNGGVDCDDAIAPAVRLITHSHPIGIAAYEGTLIEPMYDDFLVVMLSGSHNRPDARGYEILALLFNQGGRCAFLPAHVTARYKSGIGSVL